MHITPPNSPKTWPEITGPGDTTDDAWIYPGKLPEIGDPIVDPIKTPVEPFPMIPYVPQPREQHMGWECPKCGAIYAPWITGCYCFRSKYPTWITSPGTLT